MGRKAPAHEKPVEKDEGDSPLILIPTVAIETLPTTAERVAATLARDHKN